MQELVCQVLFGVSQSVASVCFGSFVYAPSTSALLYLAALQYLKLIPRCLFSSRILSWLSMEVCLFRCHCSCYRQLFLQFLVMTSVQQCANRKAFGVMSLDFYAVSLCSGMHVYAQHANLARSVCYVTLTSNITTECILRFEETSCETLMP